MEIHLFALNLDKLFVAGFVRAICLKNQVLSCEAVFSVREIERRKHRSFISVAVIFLFDPRK